MNEKLILESLASDLKRVSLGLQRNSNRMAKLFYEEALKRKSELKITTLPLYIQKILNHLDSLMTNTKRDRIAEDALMYSILIQNYAVYKLKIKGELWIQNSQNI